MKKSLILLILGLFSGTIWAQNYDPIKTLVMLNQLEKAKADLDKSFTNAKFIAKPEAYLLKATVYAGVAYNQFNIEIGAPREKVISCFGQPKEISKTTNADGQSEMLFYDGFIINISPKGVVDWINETVGEKPQAGINAMYKKTEPLLEEADAAFNKYKEMDPSMALLGEPLYQNGAINLYSSYYKFGYSEYQIKNWGAGLTKLKRAIEYSEILIKHKLLTSTLDTNVLILAGITAESGGFKDDAATYYTKLADAKIGGEGYEGVYRFLVTYTFGHKNMVGFEKYKALGKEAYPASKYFDFDKVDFAVGLADNFEGKLKAIDEILVADPENYKANQVLGELLYDTLDPRDETAVLPSNYKELENKMVNAFLLAAKNCKVDSNQAKVKIGATKEMVISILGQPKDFSKTTTADGQKEMLFYEGFSININPKGFVDWINETSDEKYPKTMHQQCENSYLYLGDHYINKAARVNDRREAHAKEMKARTKPGTLASKEDIAKRDALDKEYGETMEGAKDPYFAAAAIFASKAENGELDYKEKQQYKKVTSYLADIYGFKKALAGKLKNTADQAKWAAEEKKWNDRYESIKN